MKKILSADVDVIKVIIVSLILFTGLSQIMVGQPEYSTSNSEGDLLISSNSVIRIDSDNEFENFSAAEGLDGDGSEADPYLIEGYDIDAQGNGNGIFIGNTTVHFTIKGCSVHNASRDYSSSYQSGAAVSLYNVVNGTVTGNNCSQSFDGILLEGSSSVKVEGNSLLGNDDYGLVIEDSSDNTISRNDFLGDDGLYIYSGSDNRFYENSFEESNFFFEDSFEVYTGQTITDNNTIKGKPVYYYKNSDMNGMASPSDAGQVILGNVSNMIIEQMAISNGDIGIDVGYSSGITITENEITSYHDGIYLVGSDGCVIEDNRLERCRYGIHVFKGSDDNVISSNTVDKCNVGIRLYDCNSNTVEENIIFHCVNVGILADQGSSNNLIFKNALLYNRKSGDTYNSSDEIDITIQATDEDGKNHWNTTGGTGNYWRDWTTPDHDNNGIVEKPYKLHGSDTYDFFPLSQPPMPVLTTVPRNLTIQVYKGALNLSWSPPEYDGGSQILEYRIYRGNETTDMEFIHSVDSPRNWYLDKGLSNGHEYVYQISALNDVGESRLTNGTEATPDGVKPNLRINSPEDGEYINGTKVYLEWNGSDSGSGLDRFEIVIDGENRTEVGSVFEHEITWLSEGKHNISLVGYDNAGNKAVVSVIIYIDTVKPEIISYSPRGEMVKKDSKIILNFSEPIDRSSIDVRVSSDLNITSQDWRDQTYVYFTHDNMDYGNTYKVFVNCSDRAGNKLETFSWQFNTTDIGYVTGRVYDHEGKPVEGALVKLNTGEFDYTDEYGYYNITAHQGPHIMWISKGGLSDKTMQVDITAGKTNDIGANKLSDANVGATKYDWMILVTSIVTAILGAFAIALFIIESRKEEEMEEFDLEEYEEGEELPPDFFD
ncbi:MAG: NosD domain-containing protein [Thermoplasmatota archaeon]